MQPDVRQRPDRSRRTGVGSGGGVHSRHHEGIAVRGATDFTECGPGAVLQGLIKKIDGTVNAHGIA